MNEKWKNFFRHCFQIGTPECAVFFSVAAMVLALLFLTIGFWQTLLVAALVALGAFLGGVKDKKEWVRGAGHVRFCKSVPYTGFCLLYVRTVGEKLGRDTYLEVNVEFLVIERAACYLSGRFSYKQAKCVFRSAYVVTQVFDRCFDAVIVRLALYHCGFVYSAGFFQRFHRVDGFFPYHESLFRYLQLFVEAEQGIVARCHARYHLRFNGAFVCDTLV